MSAPRRLWVRFRPVKTESLEDYRRAAAAAGDAATGLGAHFWTFQVEGGAGGCVEFLEGPHDGALEALDRLIEKSLSGAGGGAPGELRIGPRGLRSTELG